MGPTLPRPLMGHCTTRINDTHLFVGGGFTRNELNEAMFLKTAQIYDMEEQEWTSIDDMLEGGTMSFCLQFGNRKLAVISGYNNSLVQVSLKTHLFEHNRYLIIYLRKGDPDLRFGDKRVVPRSTHPGLYRKPE